MVAAIPILAALATPRQLQNADAGTKVREAANVLGPGSLPGIKSFYVKSELKNIMEKHIDFLGTGWSFPPQFNQAAGNVELVSDNDDIRQSLNILLSTTLGERVMQPDYGCNLADYLFESLNTSLIGYLRDRVQNAILFYESRIKVERIDVTEDDSPELLNGRFTISITYTIPETNSRFNFVYDFYKNEALDSV